VLLLLLAVGSRVGDVLAAASRESRYVMAGCHCCSSSACWACTQQHAHEASVQAAAAPCMTCSM
jgi:hypothetical protein